MIRWLNRRHCRKVGHQWHHEANDTGYCMATFSSCLRCGFTTYRYWEDDRA